MVSPAALNAFFEESDTHVETIESSLLALEKDNRNANIIDELFRAVHSLKGNAGFVGLLEIHDTAHKMETFMDDIKKSGVAVDQGHRDRLFEMFDKLKLLIESAGPDSQDKEEDKPAKKELRKSAAEGREKAASASEKEPKKDEKAGAKVKTKKSFLTFMLGREEYGLDITAVREIILKRHITRVPKAKPFVAGIMNLRGMVISVIDAKKKLEFVSVQKDNAGNIIIVEENSITTGILVDLVKDIVTFDEDMIVSAETALGRKAATEYLEGIGKTEKSSIILLDVRTFCNSEEKYF